MKAKKMAFAVLALAFLLAYACKHDPLATNNQYNDPPTGGTQPCSTDTVYFQNKILPLFVSGCAKVGCHDPVSAKEGLVLNTYANIMRSNKIRPGDPNGSKIYKVIIETNAGDRMPPPPDAAFTAAQKDLVYKWIAQGAKNNACFDCDTSGASTYSLHIAPMMQTYCVGCHSGASPGGNISLGTYALVKAQVTNGKLWGSVTRASGFSAMPKNSSPLPDCKITLIKKWIDAGATNN